MHFIIFKENNLKYHFSNMFYTQATITSFCYMFDFILWIPQLTLKGADTANPNLRSFYFFFLDSKCLHTHINVKGAMQIEQVEISGQFTTIFKRYIFIEDCCRQYLGQKKALLFRTERDTPNIKTKMSMSSENATNVMICFIT